jgi:heme/copper-type cytochrome/quinol oxidase subunit 4
MLFPGDIFLKIFEYICYLTLAILLAAGLGYGFLHIMGECQNYILDNGTCSSNFYLNIASFSYTVILGTLFTFFPAILALVGVVWILRNIHHNQTMKLREEGRDNEVIKLRVFLVRIFIFIGLLVLAIWLFLNLIS